MNAEQLQALASMMTKKMEKPESYPGEAEEWRKRLYHIKRAKGERTVKIKPGDNYMENLKKRLIKTKAPPTVNKKASSKTTDK